MPPAVLTLECAKKIYELLGEYKTLQRVSPNDDCGSCYEGDAHKPSGKCIPSPDFAETIRLLPHIGEAKKDSVDGNGWIYRSEVYAGILAEKFTLAPTPEQGMIEISEYILKII
jgi:hypothetical protein